MKKIILAATVAGSALILGACGLNKEVVKIGNSSITQEEFYQELKKSNGEATLQSMIESEILSSKYTVSDAEVKSEIEKLKKSYSSEEEFKAALEQNSITTDEQLNEITKNSLLRYKAISAGVKVTDKDLEKYYEENKDNYITIAASHILVEKKEEAEKIQKELKNGGDFAELAKKYSKDGSALNGGDLGTFGKGSMVQEFEKAAFALKENEVSDIVKTEFGYHIIKVTKINEKNLKNAKEDIKKEYLMASGKYPEIMVKLLKDAKVEIKDEEFKDVIQKRIEQYEQSGQNSLVPSEEN